MPADLAASVIKTTVTNLQTLILYSSRVWFDVQGAIVVPREFFAKDPDRHFTLQL